MEPEVSFFFSECAEHARSMPLGDCARFLRGLIALSGEAAMPETLREIHHAVFESDRQLELISRDQRSRSLAKTPNS